jgi:hypothetical protein
MQDNDLSWEDLEKALSTYSETLLERMVPGEVREKFQTLDDAEQALVASPEDSEAALFIFWTIYDPETPPQLTASEELRQTLTSLKEKVYPAREPGIHIAGALYVVQKRLSAITSDAVTLEENEELLEDVLGSFGQIDTGKLHEYLKHSLDAIQGILFLEKFALLCEGKKYQDALGYLFWSILLIGEAGMTLQREGAPDAALDVQKAADACWSLLNEASSGTDWKQLAHISRQLAWAPVLDVMETTVKCEGEKLTWVEFWRLAEGRCLANLDFRTAYQLLKEQEEEWHRDRLRRDFLGDNWRDLEPESQKHLVQMERDWYQSERSGGRVEAAANELLRLFECELRALIFNRIRHSINEILKNPESRKRMNIRSRSAKRLSLSEMITFLGEAANSHSLDSLPVRNLIGNFPVSQEDRDFLFIHLPRYLRDLRDVRHAIEYHRTDAKARSGLKNMRQKALGIGEPSVLRRLLQVKRSVVRRRYPSQS